MVEEKRPPVIIIAGWSGSGKTTLLERIIPELAGRGLRLATVKHDAHGFDMDQSGKDTWRHRQAGAAVTAIASPAGFAVVAGGLGREPSLEDMIRLLGDVDLVLVEGYKRAPYPKLEVIGPAGSSIGEPAGGPVGGPAGGPACLDDPLLFAVASDHSVATRVPRFARDDAGGIAAAILRQAGLAAGR